LGKGCLQLPRLPTISAAPNIVELDLIVIFATHKYNDII
jgi:hypothetical protein